MTREETLQVYQLFSAAYDMKITEMAIETWYQVLKVHSFDDCKTAAIQYLKTQHYKPVPADINNLIMDKQISKISRPNHMSALEAWSIVYKAICKSAYNSEEEFKKLPPDCQYAIGSPQNLKEMSMMEIETVESVEQSHFIRAYEAAVKRHEKEYQIKIEQVKRGEIPIGQLSTEGGCLTDRGAQTT